MNADTALTRKKDINHGNQLGEVDGNEIFTRTQFRIVVTNSIKINVHHPLQNNVVRS